MPRAPVRLVLLLAALVGSLAPTACARPQPADGRIRVAVSVPPQAYFVDRIGGRRVATEILIPPGANETNYAPSPRQIVSLGRAALYIEVGHPAFLFESNHIAPYLAEHPEIRRVDMSEGIASLPSNEAEGRAEPRGFFGDEEEHADHASGDPHVWVAPGTVRIAARNIAQALAAIDPAHEGEYRANLTTFLAEIDALDRSIRAALAGSSGRRFMVYHPSWGYFAREYGLVQVAIESGGREPSPARLIELIENGRRDSVRAVFVQRGFARKSAEVIAEELGGRVVVVDPMAYDWKESLTVAMRAFREELDRG